MSYKIDASDPNNISNKVLSERESRKRWLSHARQIGCEREMLLLFAKYDKLLRNCTDNKERQDIAKIGVVEFYRLLGGGGQLYIDGQLIIDDEQGKI